MGKERIKEIQAKYANDPNTSSDILDMIDEIDELNDDYDRVAEWNSNLTRSMHHYEEALNESLGVKLEEIKKLLTTDLFLDLIRDRKSG